MVNAFKKALVDNGIINPTGKVVSKPPKMY